MFAAASEKFKLSKYTDFITGMDDHMTETGMLGDAMEETKKPQADTKPLPKPTSIFDTMGLTKPRKDFIIKHSGPTEAQLNQQMKDSVPLNHGPQKPQSLQQTDCGQEGG